MMLKRQRISDLVQRRTNDRRRKVRRTQDAAAYYWFSGSSRGISWERELTGHRYDMCACSETLTNVALLLQNS